MALKRKVDDAGDEDDKEQGEPTVKRSKGPGTGGPKGARPKGPCWHCGGPHLQRDCPHINDEGKEKAWPTSGAWRSWRPGPFPGPTVQHWNSWFPKPAKGKGKGKSGKGGKGKGGKSKVFGSEIGVLDSHFGWQGTHLWDTFSQIVAPTRTWFPFAAFPRHFPWKPVRGPRNCTTGSSLSRLLWKRHQKAWTRPISISNRFHVLSAHDDDAHFPELGGDTCTDRPRMPPMPKRLPQEVRKKRFLCPVEKNTQSETDFINKANDMRAQCRAEILATEASRDAHQVKMLTSDRPILSTSSRHHTPCQPPPGWQLLSLTVDSGASETVIHHDQIRGYEIRETSSTKGMNFVSASGDPIPNLGEQVLPLLTEEDTLRTMKFNACPVTKALGSVKRMCDAGHTVVFDSECSYVYNKHTGETNLMREDQDNHVLDMWVPPPEALRGQVCCEGFPGQRKLLTHFA